MNPLTKYLYDFNRLYLLERQDRRRTVKEVTKFWAAIALMVVTATILIYMGE